MNDYSHLNPAQYEAVTAPPGPVLVLAGPGSGKTRVLTQRVAYLIRDLNIRAYHILAVTFTNKAADEMRSRVEDILGEIVSGSLWIGTFHSICGRILRREAEFLPVSSNFVIMDADDQLTLIKRILKELNIDDKLYRPQSVHNEISNAKNNLLFAKDMPRGDYRSEIVARVYEKYQEALRLSNAVDFDDMLLYTHRLLQDHPDVCERYGKRFEQILVDEFQDTNAAQYQLLRKLASVNRSLFAVGDEDQSIYRWRGADYRNILQFEKDFNGCKKILLEQNYRSTQNILNAARAVIDNNANRTPKALFSDRGDGDKIRFYEAEDDRMEARYVVDTISAMIANRTASGKDFAVLYRANNQSRLLEDAFLHRGLQYRIVGAQRFYGRREIKDLIAYLRLVYNPDDEISLTRVINVPARGIGGKTLQNLRMAAFEAGQSVGKVLLDLGKNGPESPYWPDIGRGALSVADFGALLVRWTERLRGDPSIVSLLDQVVFDVGYRSYLTEDPDETDRWENVEELRQMAFEYEDRGISEFLQNLALVADQDTIVDNSDLPTLMTLHAVKGLEFNRVFIVGLDDGTLPHVRSLDDPEEMAEERRLFYVGMTRARNELTLVRSERRMNFGSIETTLPSRFLNSIPENLIQVIENPSAGSIGAGFSAGRRSGENPRWESKPTWVSKIRIKDSPRSCASSGKSAESIFASSSAISTGGKKPAAAAGLPAQKFKANDPVAHPLWGTGLVLESLIEDGEEVVRVRFEKGGDKKLIVSLSKLKKR